MVIRNLLNTLKKHSLDGRFENDPNEIPPIDLNCLFSRWCPPPGESPSPSYKQTQRNSIQESLYTSILVYRYQGNYRITVYLDSGMPETRGEI